MKRHEKEFEQYLEDWKNHDEPWKLWEIRHVNNEVWDEMWKGNIALFGHEDYEFRRKPETIKPDTWELPKPLTVEPEPDTNVWLLNPDSSSGKTKLLYNPTNFWHKIRFNNRTLFAEEDHVKAWVAWWRSEIMDHSDIEYNYADPIKGLKQCPALKSLKVGANDQRRSY